mmetsp:Transcript_74695/g.216766  ORF Transcript_74695/g.216766 Transcript_74695/m.216766 type:complete len:346 (-) Transcript_74695:1011-2048(-)
MVQEGAVVVVDLEAEGMVEADRVGAERAHHSEVVAAIGAPLRRIARLRHVLRGQAPAAASMLCAGKRAVGDAVHGAQRRQDARREAHRLARGRGRGGRQGRRLLRARGRRARDGHWRLHRRGAGAHPNLAHGDAALPRRRNRCGAVTEGAQQPRQLRAEAAHRPRRARRGVVADLPGRMDLGAQAEEPEVHLRSSLLVCGLELEEGRTDEPIAPAGCGQHGLQVGLNSGRWLAVGTILPDEPRRGPEPRVVLGDHLVDEGPRRLGVQAVYPSLGKCVAEVCQRRPRLVPRDAGVLDRRSDVLEPKDARARHEAIDGCPQGERPRRRQLHSPAVDSGLLLRGQDAI